MRAPRAGDRPHLGADDVPHPLSPVAIGAIFGVTLVLALVPKLLCLNELAAGEPERHWCKSDLKRLYDERGFDVDAVPYADAPPGYPLDYVFEYPPGLGLPAYGLARLADTRIQFFALNAATLLLAAVVVAWALARALVALRRPRERLLLYVASPGLAVFALNSWDLWSVAPAAAGLAAAASGRRRLAGGLLGLGAAVKWWPALLLVLLLFGPWSGTAPSGTRRRWGWERIAPAVIAAGVWAVVQVPALFVSPSNWWGSMEVHFARRPNPDGFFGAVADIGNGLMPSDLWGEPYTRAVGIFGAVGLLAGTAYVARRLERGTLTPGNAALPLIVIFIVVSKVQSPNFGLWVLPAAAISSVAWRYLLIVEVLNIAVWYQFSGKLFDLGLWTSLAIVRMVAFVVLLLVALRQHSLRDHASTDDAQGYLIPSSRSR